MDILTPDDLATMLGLKRKTIIDHYTKQPGFPAPLSQRRPRWLESEVRRFMQRKSAQNSHKPPKPA